MSQNATITGLQQLALNEVKMLDSFFTKHDFDGDSINSLPNNRTLMAIAKANRLCGVAVRQVFRLSPLNFRSLVGPRDDCRNPQAMITLARAYLRIYCALGGDDYKRKGIRLLQWVENIRSPRFAHFCIPQLAQLFVSNYTATREDISPLLTCYAGKLFLEAHSITGDERYLDLAHSVADYFTHEHPREMEPSGIYFHYVPGLLKKIYNCSAEISSFLVQAAVATGQEDFRKLGLAGLEYVASTQNSDGSWFYGDSLSSKYVDNFHTAYILQALIEALELHPDPDLLAVFQRGLDYYEKELFISLPAGCLRPRHFDPRHLPRNSNLVQKVDLRDSASSIILFTSLAHKSGRVDARVAALVQWTAEHMRSADSYCSELTWLWANRIPYIDIVSWHFLALAYCLTKTESSRKTHDRPQ